MNLINIIKNALIFPSKNLETLSIFAILSVLSGAFLIQGIVTCILGIVNLWNLVIGIIYIAVSIIMGFIINRISIQCIKSGIDLEEKLPDFNWFQSLSTGFSKVVITIFYFIIPAIIIVFVALITNILGNIIDLAQEIIIQIPNLIIGNSIVATEAINNASFPLFMSLAVTFSLSLIIFLIFTFFQAMGEARLAHTGSLKQALNIYGAAKDITRIGVGKVILISILIFVIVSIIEGILAVIFNHLIVLSILSIITTPYITLFSQRALGLLYSDIVES